MHFPHSQRFSRRLLQMQFTVRSRGSFDLIPSNLTVPVLVEHFQHFFKTHLALLCKIGSDKARRARGGWTTGGTGGADGHWPGRSRGHLRLLHFRTFLLVHTTQFHVCLGSAPEFYTMLGAGLAIFHVILEPRGTGASTRHAGGGNVGRILLVLG